MKNSKQKGQILVITLIIMFILSLIALSTAIGISRGTQQRVFNETYEQNYQNAESRILQSAEVIRNLDTTTQILNDLRTAIEPLSELSGRFDNTCTQNSTTKFTCEIEEECIKTDLTLELKNSIDSMELSSSDVLQLSLEKPGGSFYVGPISLGWTGQVVWSISLIYEKYYFNPVTNAFDKTYDVLKGSYDGRVPSATGFTIDRRSTNGFRIVSLSLPADAEASAAQTPVNALEVDPSSCQYVSGPNATCPNNKVVVGSRVRPGSFTLDYNCCDFKYAGQVTRRGVCGTVNATISGTQRVISCPAGRFFTGGTTNSSGLPQEIPVNGSCCTYLYGVNTAVSLPTVTQIDTGTTLIPNPTLNCASSISTAFVTNHVLVPTVGYNFRHRLNCATTTTTYIPPIQRKLIAIRFRPMILSGESTYISLNTASDLPPQFAEINSQAANTCVGDSSPTPLLTLKLPLNQAPPGFLDYVLFDE